MNQTKAEIDLLARIKNDIEFKPIELTYYQFRLLHDLNDRGYILYIDDVTITDTGIKYMIKKSEESNGMD